jgi:rare lipoprotein A
MSVFRGPVPAGFALLATVVLSAVLSVSGCGRHTARAKVPLAPARIGSTETGVASWYGIPYHGRRAASGEVYDMEALTAAHRKLPFQTWVEVTNLSNGRRIDVRINDRGPFARGRIIDLSQAAARDIDMLGPGTAPVRLKVIARPHEIKPETKIAASAPLASPEPRTSPAPRPAPASPAAPASLPGMAIPIDWYAVQAGAFADPDRAELLRATLEDIFMDARVIAGDRNLWRVVVGREMTLEQANELAVRVRKELGAALVVPEPRPSAPDTPAPDPATPK